MRPHIPPVARFAVLVFTLCAPSNTAGQRTPDVVATAVERGDYATALREGRARAAKGDAHAQYLLGVLYFKGLGVRPDAREAAAWFRRAADQGHEYGKFMLGITLNSLGQFEESAQILRWAAGTGNASAQTLLAFQYVNGNGVPKDMKEAFKYFKMAADQGYASAQTKVGQFLASGIAVPQNIELGIQYLRQAADQDETDAEAILGSLLYEGYGVKADPREGVKWWLKAAAQGHTEAQSYLGLAYYEGKGVEQNFGEAARWFRSAASSGDSKSQYQMGLLYHHGLGVAKDPVEALTWMRLAVNGGHRGDEKLIRQIQSSLSPAQLQQVERAVAQRSGRP